jgi:hypothetical protein
MLLQLHFKGEFRVLMDDVRTSLGKGTAAYAVERGGITHQI